MRNTFGNIFTLTSFGESHGTAVGGVIDGMPPGIEIDVDFIQRELDRRKPGQSNITTARKEEDKVEFLSGIFQGISTGCPIAFVVYNNNQISKDYSEIKDIFRPSHADYTYFAKYGIRDYRGGGRTSARETIARVVAGALAKLVLRKFNINISAFTAQVGDIKVEKDYKTLNFDNIEKNNVRCPDIEIAEKMEKLILEVKKEGDTIGGIISCVISGCPKGIGEPVFDKLHADLGAAMLSINAAKGFEYGSGFKGATQRGSQQNDQFVNDNGSITTVTNRSGGIQGGISNGQDIYFNVAFKPVPTILKQQETVDKWANHKTIQPKGRHDPCVLPRAVPVVEAMAALVLLDHILMQNAYDFTDNN